MVYKKKKTPARRTQKTRPTHNNCGSRRSVNTLRRIGAHNIQALLGPKHPCAFTLPIARADERHRFRNTCRHRCAAAVARCSRI